MEFNDKIIKQIDSYEVELPANDWEILSQKLNQKRRKTLPLWWYAAAAGVVLLVGFGFAFFNTQTTQIEQIYADNNVEKIDSIVKNELNTKQNIQIFADNKSKNLIINLKKSKISVPSARVKTAESTENLHSGEENNDIEFDNKNLMSPDVEKQPKDKQISIDDAEKLMQEVENSKKGNQTNGKQSSNKQYYASLSASSSPTTFGKIAQEPKRMFLWGFNGDRPIKSSTRDTTIHDLPLTFGFTFGIPLAKRLYLNTGIQYTYIHSKTEKFDSDMLDLISRNNQNLHYLGIPMMLAYRIIDGKILKLYVSGGGVAEKGLLETHNQRNFKEINPENVTIQTDEKNKYIPGFQFSLNANIGASVTLFKGLSLYVEPGFAWYIPAKKYVQPASRRTENPYFFSITAGLRFNFEK